MTACISMLLKSRASLTCFRACFLRGRAKDLTAPWYQTHVLQYDTQLRLMVNMHKKPITVVQNGISMSRTEYIRATDKISKTIVTGH